jgi:hypothetical protein
MRIPVWLTIVAAIFVTGFGAFRIYVATRKADPSADPDAPRSGFNRMSSRMNLAMGVIYILLGVGLIAVSAGWNPLGGMFSSDTKKPAKDEAPTQVQMPKDQLPEKK